MYIHKRGWARAEVVAACAIALALVPFSAGAASGSNLTSSAASESHTGAHMTAYRVRGSFDDVFEDVTLAVTDRGIKINNVSHIGAMLERTGKDVGGARRVFGKAKAIEFCSAVLSRQMMEADPRNIVFCPFVVSVYELASEPDAVYVAYRHPTLVGDRASREALKAVGELLDAIAREASGR